MTRLAAAVATEYPKPLVEAKMATTLKLPFVRFVAQVNTAPAEPKANYQALAARNALALQSCEWREAAKSAKASLVTHNFTVSHSGDQYDAYLMTGDYNAENSTEVAYAGMAAYRFTLPAAYISGSQTLVSMSLPVTRDRFLLPGVRVVAALSDSAQPSASWAVVRGEASPAASETEYLKNSATRITAALDDSGTLALDLTGTDTTKKPYLWIYLTVEDYAATWTMYSKTEPRLYAIEGSAMIVGEDATVTFSADVTPDALECEYRVMLGGVMPEMPEGANPVRSVTLMRTGDVLPLSNEVDGTLILPDRDRIYETPTAAQGAMGLRSLYAKLRSVAFPVRAITGRTRPGAAFTVRQATRPVLAGDGSTVQVPVWQMCASALVVPFAAPVAFAAKRIRLDWDDWPGTASPGAVFRVWLARGTLLGYDDSVLSSPALYEASAAQVGQYGLVASIDATEASKTATIDIAPLTHGLATLILSAYVSMDAVNPSAETDTAYGAGWLDDDWISGELRGLDTAWTPDITLLG